MTPISIGSSRGKFLALLIVCVAFVIGGGFLIFRGQPGDLWGGGLVIVIFTGCAAVFLWQLRDSRPRLVISDEGIFDRRLGVGTIPWSDMTAAHVQSIKGQKFVCLVLRNQDEWLERLPPLSRAMSYANRALGFSSFNLNLSGINQDPDQVHELITKMIAVANGTTLAGQAGSETA